MSKGFDLPSNKHLGNSHDYWKAPQKNSKQIIVQSLQWLPIDRDENGRITDDCYYSMLDTLDTHPCFVVSADLNHCDYLIVTQLTNIGEWYDLVMANPHYTHYLPIPKSEV